MPFADAGPSDTSLSLAYTADLLVLVLSDLKSLSTPSLSRLLLDLSSKPNLLLALSTSSPFPALAATRAFQAQLGALVDPSLQSPVAPVQIEQALEALASLTPTAGVDAAEPSFELFQQGYVMSGVPQLRERLALAVQAIQQDVGGGTSVLQLQTAQYVLEKVISVAVNAAGRIEAGLSAAEADVATLAAEAALVEREALQELGVKDGRLEVPEVELQESLARLDAMLVDRVQWWQLPSRGDDITLEVSDEARRSFLTTFEDSLIFRTGRMLALSTKLDEATQSLLSSRSLQPPHDSGLHPLASIHSPILANDVARAALPASPSALSHVLVARRAQISAPGGPAELLHSRAQKAVLSSATFSLSTTAASSWAVLAGLAELPTGVGLSFLGITMGAWGLQRGWDKAKRKFTRDVGERITGGLEVDLGERAGLLVERMGWQAKVAVSGSLRVVERKREALREFEEGLRRIEAGRREL